MHCTPCHLVRMLTVLVTVCSCLGFSARINAYTHSSLYSISTDQPCTQDSVITLQQLLVEAKAHPISQHGDTMIYAVPAFATYEGERLKALLNNLPGIDVLSDGTIKARGRTVEKLLLNGHELYGISSATVIENLPAAYLQSVVLYNDATRQEKETGIREGMGEQVIDLITTEENRAAWLSDVSAGTGTRHRFAMNASAGKYTDESQRMFSGTFDNLPSMFGIGESFYDKLQKTIGTADTRHHNLNASISWFHGQWDIKASSFYDGAKKEDCTQRDFTAFLYDHSSTNSMRTDAVSHHNAVNAQASISWNDSLWTVHIDPVVSWNKSRYDNNYYYCSYADNAEVNRATGTALNKDDALSASIQLSVNRKLSANGRNFGIRWRCAAQRGNDEFMYDDDILFPKSMLHTTTLRRSNGHDNASSSAISVSYTEPVARSVKLMLEYECNVSLREAEHPVMVNDMTREWIYSDSLSREAKSRNDRHNARLSLQYAKGHLRTTAGFKLESNRVHTVNNRYLFSIDTVRYTNDWNPEFSLCYTLSDGTSLSASYGGRSRQPNIIDLLHGDDCSDPINVRRGNPGLKSSFVHQLRFSFYHFRQQSQFQLNASAGFDWEHRSVTDRVLFDADKGIHYYMPTNVDGNRSFMANWGMQIGLVSDNVLWLDMQGDFSCHRLMGFQSVVDNIEYHSISDEFKYSTVQSQLMQYAALQFQPGRFSVKPYAYLKYNHLASTLAGSFIRDTFIYGYGALARYDTSIGLSAVLDIYEHCSRGYIEPSCNADRLVIDIELAYSFLRNRSAEVRLIACDLLGNHDILESMYSPAGCVESQALSAVNNYVMATLTYRF